MKLLPMTARYFPSGSSLAESSRSVQEERASLPVLPRRSTRTHLATGYLFDNRILVLDWHSDWFDSPSKATLRVTIKSVFVFTGWAEVLRPLERSSVG